MNERIPLEFYCWELTSRCQLLHLSDESTFKPFPSQKVFREGNSFSLGSLPNLFLHVVSTCLLMSKVNLSCCN